jgi:hypothetical protein
MNEFENEGRKSDLSKEALLKSSDCRTITSTDSGNYPIKLRVRILSLIQSISPSHLPIEEISSMEVGIKKLKMMTVFQKMKLNTHQIAHLHNSYLTKEPI